MKIRLIQWFLFSSLLIAGPPALAADEKRPTEGFRKEHAAIKEHLRHLHEMTGSIAASDAAAQRKTAQFVVNFLNEHIRSHARWEEERLYPAVDRRTHAGMHPFTSSMRYEHGIIGRGIDEIGRLAGATTFDSTSFTRRTDRLLGVIDAHFEKEEEVFLPILDKTMTREELEKELGTDKADH
jgi:hemerythrin-like domain-containing protein